MANGAETAAPLLEARRISKFIRAITALNDVNFRVTPGDVFEVAGDNGADKSTPMKIPSRLNTPSAAVSRTPSRQDP
jgi:ribose transport system ATP-binding protein